MRRTNLALIGIIFLMLPTSSQAQTPASFRVLFGVTDATPTRWDGTVTLKQAGQCTLEGWRFEGADNIDGNLFHFSTHSPRMFISATSGGAIVANGLIVGADAVTESSEFTFTTAQGDFGFRAADVPTLA